MRLIRGLMRLIRGLIRGQEEEAADYGMGQLRGGGGLVYSDRVFDE